MDKTAVRFVTLCFLVSIPFSSVACGGPESGPDLGATISRDQFVEAYFELRAAGLRSRGMDITLATRDSVLAELGLAEADLLTFAEVWGDDGEMMISVWEEVDSLIRETRTNQGEEEEGVFDPSGEGGGRNQDRGGGREGASS